MKRFLKRLFCTVFTLALLCCISITAIASSEAIDLDSSCSIRLLYTESQNLSGVRFSVYRVADINETMGLNWTPTYEGYHLGLSMNDPQTLALALASYTLRDGISPTNTAITDENGEILFEGLRTGMYLIMGENYSRGDYIYSPIPALIYFPYTGSDGHWTYSADVEVKFERTLDKTVCIRALKVWDDERSLNRPDSIKVDLLRDGFLWEVVELSEENNWRYTWNGLKSGHIWSVVEDEVPDGYTTSITRDGVIFVITNTMDKPEVPNDTEDPTPSEPTNPPKEDSPFEFPSKPTDEPSAETPTEPTISTPPQDMVEIPTQPVGNENLPQTGLNWDPIIYLSTSGIVCLLIGLILNRKGSKEQ